MKRIALALALVVPALAEANPVEIAQTALKAGSDRLAIYALSHRELAQDIRIEAAKLSIAQGFSPEKKASLLGHEFTWAPIFTWDPNVNGGTHRDGFSFGGYDFLFDPSIVGKAGLMIGASGQLSARWQLGSSTRLDAFAVGSYAYSPEHKAGKAQIGTGACIEKLLDRDFYLRGCATAMRQKTELTDDSRYQIRAGASKLMHAFGGTHELTGMIGRTWAKDHENNLSWAQNSLTLSGLSIFEPGSYWTYGVTLGEKVKNQKVQTLGLNIGRGQQIFGKDVLLGASYSKRSGGHWLGTPVWEEAYGISATAQLSKKLSAEVSFTKVKSGAEFFRGNEVQFSVNWKF